MTPAAPSRADRLGPYTVLTLTLVFVGGGAGTFIRYLAENLNPAQTDEFPWGTMLANVTGALGLGLLTGYLMVAKAPPFVQPLVATGFFGAFTTFSTFAVEVAQRLRDSLIELALLYAAATLVLGLTAAFIGYHLGRRLTPQQQESPS
ncbi:fluoride efflux transporter CrcB [Gordonia jinghuaiqii]|uniref:Fluoride-specific ion channel FluC n=1 Tax=Gordonia jinghuaiqii TaxID=2758710 RepID=A0A7D7QZH0_9ACTN|nr:fluoride efflux transporter CrcB [Gordonia jinghuaiqii]MCR5978566.1 fluoride efflux transporter CrcB [Gordonia jinghuaiqii]QMT02889.1 fluoride efflux transporter CrcB [Gordonia jinghuaiqii]